MLAADLDSLALGEYIKNAPLCDGNHEWVADEEDEKQGEQHCAKCFVIKEDGDIN